MILLRSLSAFGLILLIAMTASADSWIFPQVFSNRSYKNLNVGKTEIGLSTYYSVIEKRFSVSGQKVNSANIYQIFSSEASSSANDTSESAYSVEKISYVAQLTNQLTKDWSIGLLMPVHYTQYQTQDNVAGIRSTEKYTLLGNLEIAGEGIVFNSEKQRLYFVPRLVFPSEEKFQPDKSPELIRLVNNYVLSIGGKYITNVSTSTFGALFVGYNYTFEDKVKNIRTGNSLARNPGDELVTQLTWGKRWHSRLQSEFGILRVDKQKDKLLVEAPANMYSVAGSASNNAGLLDFKYQWETKNERSAEYGASLRLIKSIAGRNSDDLSSVGLTLSSTL